ncbi:MAG: hypothetical protein M1837_005479 [Sclerophora amabilis]|nr:MAG: hypothetical protein M1837_005479 [Sclerophora amabilis]
MASSGAFAKAVFPLLAAASYYCTWGLSERNGHFKSVEQVGSAIPNVLPRTDAALKRSYVGIEPIDDLLTTLTILFWPALDGSSPQLSLFSFHFAGQVVPLCVVLMVESRRLGNKWRIVSFITLWILVFQVAGFTNVIPFYALIHLFTSPTASLRATSPNTPSTNLLVSLPDLVALPISVTLGHIAPAILMSLPSPTFFSFNTRQTLLSLWQVFPVTISLLQFVLSSLISVVLPYEPQYHSTAERNARTLRFLRRVYIFGFTISSITHIATWTISLSSIVVPMIFDAGLVDNFSPARVFLPPLPNSTAPATDLGEGLLFFLHYDEYLGFLSLGIWATALYRGADAKGLTLGGWVRLLAKIVGITVVAGPATAALALIWARDELILGEVGEVDGKKML